MTRSQRAHGYTIIEVMIFLVITGVLLSSAILVFNGRQRRTQFTQGVREIDSQIRTIINETASGYYPNKGDISCTSTDGGGPQLSSASGQGQGTNAGCIYLGRVLAFTNTETYRAYTVVGQQKGADGQEVTALGDEPNEAKQTLITPSDSQPNVPDATSSFELPWGITVTEVHTPLPGAANTGAVGFIATFGSYSTSGEDLVSGSSGLSSIPLTSTNLSSGAEALVTATQSMTDAQRNPGRIVVCLLSGGGDRRAAILIGGNNSSTGTEVVIDDVPGECLD